MLATTLGFEFDSDESWDEKTEVCRLSNQIVRTQKCHADGRRRQERPLDDRRRRCGAGGLTRSTSVFGLTQHSRNAAAAAGVRDPSTDWRPPARNSPRQVRARKGIKVPRPGVEAPARRGARSAHTGRMQATSNDARRMHRRPGWYLYSFPGPYCEKVITNPHEVWNEIWSLLTFTDSADSVMR